RVLLEQPRVDLGRRPAVQVLVLDGDEAFVEQRIALAAHLDEVAETLVAGRTENPDTAPARRRIDADDLLIAAELVDRNVERQRVDVESALRVHGRVRGTQLQQVEDRLDVGVEPIVSLAGERAVSVVEPGDRLRRVEIQLAFSGHAVLCRLLPIVVAVVLRRSVALVVWRYDPTAQARDAARAPVHLVDRVALDEILRGVADVADDAEI